MSIYPCNELIEDIFGRLPPKTLLRFRSLSKSWYSRISSPDFIHRHRYPSVKKNLIRHRTYQNNSPEDIYTLHSEEQLPLCPVDPYKNITPVKFHGRYPVIVGSYNGILCLFDYTDDDCRLCLWNFSIRRKLTLPDHPCLRSKSESPSDVAIGFGFDSVTNDYKIVCISHSEYRQFVKKSYLYSMKINSWIEISCPLVSKLKSYQACFVNGTLHWVVRYHDRSIASYGLSIMTFDLSTHVFGRIKLPEPWWNTRELTIISGALAVISRDKPRGHQARFSHTHIDKACMWVRREHNNVSSWSLVLTLDMSNYEDSNVMKPITNGCLVFQTWDWYKIFNHETKVFSRLIEFRDTCRQIQIQTYVESLELLDKGTSYGETISWKKWKKRKRSLSTIYVSGV